MASSNNSTPNPPASVVDLLGSFSGTPVHTAPPADQSQNGACKPTLLDLPQQLPHSQQQLHLQTPAQQQAQPLQAAQVQSQQQQQHLLPLQKQQVQLLQNGPSQQLPLQVQQQQQQQQQPPLAQQQQPQLAQNEQSQSQGPQTKVRRSKSITTGMANGLRRLMANVASAASSSMSSNTPSSAHSAATPTTSSSQNHPSNSKHNATFLSLQRDLKDASNNSSAASLSKQTIGPAYSCSIDSYQILDQIGIGSSGRVFLAEHRPNGVKVSIKAIELESLERDQIEGIRRETNVMALCRHPNVLSVFCSFVHESSLLIVTPYLSGGSVLDIMRSAHPEGLEENCIAVILRQAVQGIEYIHRNGHIHRDIKCGNLLVDAEGTVVLADFGVTASIEGNSSKATRKTFVGTPCWMAPEVIEQSLYNNKADIWSLGITSLEMAHGHAPLARYPPIKVLMLTLTSEPPSLDRAMAKHQYSRSFKEFCDACLQRDPEKRLTATALLSHSFLRSVKKKSYLVTHLLTGLEPLPDRMRARIKASNTGLRAAATAAGIFSHDRHTPTSWEFDFSAPVQEQKPEAAPQNTAAAAAVVQPTSATSTVPTVTNLLDDDGILSAFSAVAPPTTPQAESLCNNLFDLTPSAAVNPPVSASPPAPTIVDLLALSPPQVKTPLPATRVDDLVETRDIPPGPSIQFTPDSLRGIFEKDGLPHSTINTSNIQGFSSVPNTADAGEISTASAFSSFGTMPSNRSYPTAPATNTSTFSGDFTPTTPVNANVSNNSFSMPKISSTIESLIDTINANGSEKRASATLSSTSSFGVLSTTPQSMAPLATPSPTVRGTEPSQVNPGSDASAPQPSIPQGLPPGVTVTTMRRGRFEVQTYLTTTMNPEAAAYVTAAVGAPVSQDVRLSPHYPRHPEHAKKNAIPTLPPSSLLPDSTTGSAPKN